jgi:outer membrane protein assembly factor BamB
VLGPYCDLELIGGGGMGDVYRARDPHMGNRTVAIKIPLTGINPERVKQRFEREIVASARLQHENAVRAYDRGEESGRPYLVMEFVSGRKLNDLVRQEHPLAPRRVGRIILGVAKALAHAEQQGVVNRDVKPANVLLAEVDDTPKVLDYGLALISEVEEQVTQYGTLLGTIGFVAPEQAAGPHSVTIAADVYSLGCTAFYCLAARPPFQGAHADDTLRQHAEAPRPSVTEIRPDAPHEFDQLIREMMASDRRVRPTPQQIVERLERLIPRLADRVPTLSHHGGPGTIDVVCPSCDNVYHLPCEWAGKRVRCPNKLCGATLTVQPPDDTLPPPPPEIAGPAADARDLPEAEIVEAVPADVLDAEPVDAKPGIDGGRPEVGWPVPLAGAAVHPDAQTGDTQPTTDYDVSTPGEPPACEEEPGVAFLTAKIADTEDRHADVDMLPPEAVVATPGYDARDDGFAATAPPPEVAAAEPAFPATPFEAGEPKPAARRRKMRAKRRPEKKPKTRRERRAAQIKWLVGGSCAVLLCASLITVWLSWGNIRPRTPDESWAEIMGHYDEHKWDRVLRELDDFEAEHPGDPHVDQIPFFRDLCKAGEHIYSLTGDAEQGWELLRQIYMEHRDNPAYKDYSIDIYQGLVKVIDRLLEQAESASDPDMVARVREAYELLETVGEARTEPFVAEKIAELRSRIAQADHSVTTAQARQEVVSLLHTDRIRDPGTDVDEIYAAVQARFEQNPALRENQQLEELLRDAYEVEPQRVSYQPEDVAAQARLRPTGRRDLTRQSRTLVVAWGGNADQGRRPGPDQVVLALARGILYAFDKRDGTLYWARRLGMDSDRLPISVRPTSTSPTSLIAVNSEDSELLSLDPSTGQVLWRYAVCHDVAVPLTLAGGVFFRYRVNEDIAAPLTVVSRKPDRNAPETQWGLLPTAEGEIHVLELVLGRRLGRFRVGYPMSLGGCYDRESGLAFFPADAGRIFAVDPAAIDDPREPACHSILFTDHASGSLRSEPVVVGQYLVVSEASELEHTRLKAFAVRKSGFPAPTGLPPANRPLKQLSLNGWAWFSPDCGPDRITVVTDRGDLALFGLNLDNEEEAIYPIIEPTEGQHAVPTEGQHAEQLPFRTMAVHAEEHLLWVIAGGRLQKLSVDVLRQQINPVWTSGESVPGVTGIPVHKPEIDRANRLFYLTTMSPSGHTYRFTAINADTGGVEWQRRLGVDVLADPVVLNDGVAIIDRTGQIYRIRVDPLDRFIESDVPKTTQHPDRDGLPEGADPHKLMRLGHSPGPIHLVAPVDDGAKLAVKTVSDLTKGSRRWTEVTLTEPLYGRPCVCDDGGDGFLVVPCRNGCLYRFSVSDGSLLGGGDEQPYIWRSCDRSGADVYPLGLGRILLVEENGSCLRRLRTHETTEGIVQWVEEGGSQRKEFYLEASLEGQPLLRDGKLFVLDSSNALYVLDPDDPNWYSEAKPVGVEVAAGPFVREGHLLVISEDARLACLAVDERGDVRPRWITEPFLGWIRGMPRVAGDTLLVADSSRTVTGIRLSDGKAAWTAPLGVRVGPSAAPVPYGRERMMVPLVDGTLLVLPIPTERIAQ